MAKSCGGSQISSWHSAVKVEKGRDTYISTPLTAGSGSESGCHNREATLEALNLSQSGTQAFVYTVQYGTRGSILYDTLDELRPAFRGCHVTNACMGSQAVYQKGRSSEHSACAATGTCMAPDWHTVYRSARTRRSYCFSRISRYCRRSKKERVSVLP